MAQKVWNGTGGVVGKWNDALNWTPNGVPVDADQVYFTPTNNQDVTDVTGTSTTDLDFLYVQKGNNSKIGATGTRLQVGVDTALIRGTNEFWWNPQLLCDRVWIDRDTPEAVVDIDVEATITHAMFCRGTCTALITSNISNVYVTHHSNMEDDVTLAINASISTISTYIQKGGNVTCAEDISTLIMEAGQMTLTGGGPGTIIQSGGVLTDKSTADDVSSVILYGGILDMSQLPRARTITTLITGGDGVFIRPTDDSLTVTNDVDANRLFLRTA